jgi:hypothetical protein
MRKLYLVAQFDIDVLERDERIRQDIHHPYLFPEGDHDMEAGRVEGDCQCFFGEALAQVEAEMVGLVVRPQTDSPVIGAGS